MLRPLRCFAAAASRVAVRFAQVRLAQRLGKVLSDIDGLSTKLGQYEKEGGTSSDCMTHLTSVQSLHRVPNRSFYQHPRIGWALVASPTVVITISWRVKPKWRNMFGVMDNMLFLSGWIGAGGDECGWFKQVAL